ncbi:tyrosine-protein phosphatase 1-like [Cotesia glomerata]|uniref:tyrosine-protein phosphatase 1-like n=1 Tax=Cotesia glomerata TaxID=32391 RepID=UPI001D00597F|nr:tyrosine-protein phosphatase 1-like [Cotesia glomerata]
MGCRDSKSLNPQEFIKFIRRRNLLQILNREFNEVIRKEQCDVGNVEAPILPQENKSGGKISANYLNGWAQKRRFICTQAPREKTEFEFWRIILKHRVRIIVMLCKDSQEQFYKYWESDVGVVKTVRPFRIETVKVKSFPNYKVTTLNVTNDATGEFLEVIHYACIDWVQFCTIQGMIDFLTSRIPGNNYSQKLNLSSSNNSFQSSNLALLRHLSLMSLKFILPF